MHAALREYDAVAVEELDLGVLHVERRPGVDWVARIFPTREPSAVEQEAKILGWLADRDFPAERPVRDPGPVLEIAGAPTLVTEFCRPVPRSERRDAIKAAGGLRELGAMLARLQALPADGDATARPGGAWHHLATGGPDAELSGARTWLAEASNGATPAELGPFAELHEALDGCDDGGGLPEAFGHPDFVLPNVVATWSHGAPGMVVVDWAGAGRCARIWPLGFLLFAEGMKNLARIDLVAAGYLRAAGLESTGLEPEELRRLAGVVRARALVLGLWHLHTRQATAAEVAAGAARTLEAAEAITEHARRALAGARSDRPSG